MYFAANITAMITPVIKINIIQEANMNRYPEEIINIANAAVDEVLFDSSLADKYLFMQIRAYECSGKYSCGTYSCINFECPKDFSCTVKFTDSAC